MALFVVDANSGAPATMAEAQASVTRNSMSWRRLAESLRESGQVAPYEELTHLIIGADGIQLCFKMKEPNS